MLPLSPVQCMSLEKNIRHAGQFHFRFMATKLKWTLGVTGKSECPNPFTLLLSHLTPHFSSEDLNIKESIQITIKCMERCSVILVIKRMKIKTLVGHHDTHIKMAKI